MLRKTVSLLPVDSLVVMSSKDSGGEKFETEDFEFQE